MSKIPYEVVDKLEEAGYRHDAKEFKFMTNPEAAIHCTTPSRLAPIDKEDDVPEDLNWLWVFEYEGRLLTNQEVFAALRILRRNGKITPYDAFETLSATPPVMAALAQATRESRIKFHVNVNAVIKQLSAVLEGNIADFVEIDSAGSVRLKDTSKLDRMKFAAIQEIVEVPTPNGKQVKLKLYDKMVAINTAIKLLDMNPPERKEITISGLEDRLNAALERRDALRDVIEGELASDE